MFIFLFCFILLSLKKRSSKRNSLSAFSSSFSSLATNLLLTYSTNCSFKSVNKSVTPWNKSSQCSWHPSQFSSQIPFSSFSFISSFNFIKNLLMFFISFLLFLISFSFDSIFLNKLFPFWFIKFIYSSIESLGRYFTKLLFVF